MSKNEKKLLAKYIIGEINVVKEAELLAIKDGIRLDSVESLVPAFMNNHEKDRDIQVQELLTVVETVQSAMASIIPDEAVINVKMLDNIREFCSRNYKGKFWNEIPNPPITEMLVDRFKAIFSVKDPKFMVSLYDINDEEIRFENKEYLEAFIEKYDCAPCAAFALVDGAWYEMYSF